MEYKKSHSLRNVKQKVLERIFDVSKERSMIYCIAAEAESQ